MNESYPSGLWLWQGKPPTPSRRMPYLGMLALLGLVFSLFAAPASDSAVDRLSAVSARAEIPTLPPITEAVSVPEPALVTEIPPRRATVSNIVEPGLSAGGASPKKPKRRSPLAIHGVLTPPDDWR